MFIIWLRFYGLFYAVLCSSETCPSLNISVIIRHSFFSLPPSQPFRFLLIQRWAHFSLISGPTLKKPFVSHCQLLNGINQGLQVSREIRGVFFNVNLSACSQIKGILVFSKLRSIRKRYEVEFSGIHFPCWRLRKPLEKADCSVQAASSAFLFEQSGIGWAAVQ